MGKIDREYIVREVSKAIGYRMKDYNLCDIIDDIGVLSNWEKQWAKEHFNWKVYKDGGE